MRTDPLSNCEKAFILETFAQNTRIDGRKCTEYRETKVVIGAEFGSCIATIGNSKVSVQVSCALVEPSSTRGNMGTVEVHVDMSPMACAEYEEGRLGAKGVELMRILELIYRDCGVLDLESLCLRAYKQVWQIRIDVHVLDADGSLVDCASIASLTALAHFRRPEVTVLPDAIIIHKNDEKPPIPLNIYHMPICTTFGITTDSKNIVTDPSEKEEQCLMGALIVAANKRQEVCNLHQTGHFLLTEELIVQCMDLAIQRAVDVYELISSVITDDNLKRSKRESIGGFNRLTSLNMLASNQCEPNELIAPAVRTDLLQFRILGERVTISENRVEIVWEQGEEGSEIPLSEMLEQVQEIAAITASTNSDAETRQQKRKDELQEVNDLLEGIEEEFCNDD